MGAPRVTPKPPDPVERVWYNSNYGQGRALRLYSGYPATKSINAVVPHGVFYETDYVFDGEAQAPVPAVLNWPAQRDKAWSKHKVVIPMAAPFLYALEVFDHAPERKGTIVMPQHSTTLLDFEMDWWAFYDEVKRLPKPITVLLYYNDVQQDCHRYFPGMRVRTCGHVNDQRFLERLVGYMTGAEYVVSNEVGSYTQYATAAGAKFRLTEAGRPRFYLNQMGIDNGFEGIFHGTDDRHPDEKKGVAEIDALYRGRDLSEPITIEQRESSDYWLRRSAFKSPEGLLADLEFCSKIRRKHAEAWVQNVSAAGEAA